jgi:uncharacterized membrane protein YkoI
MSVLRALCLMWGMLTLNYSAAHDLGPDEALRLRQNGVILPLEQLTAKALALHEGSAFLEAELELEHGRYVYEIEIVLPGGQVRELEFDAMTGVLLEDKEDN